MRDGCEAVFTVPTASRFHIVCNLPPHPRGEHHYDSELALSWIADIPE